MDGFQARLKDSIGLRLAFWLSVAIVAFALCASTLTYIGALREANELQDDTLRQVAALVARQPDPAPSIASGARNADPESNLIIQLLSRELAGAGAALPLPTTLHDGVQTVVARGVSYRVFVTTSARGDRIAVCQQTELRDEIARDGALRALLPLLLLAPLLVLLVAYLVRKMMGPVAILSRDVDARSQHELHPLATEAVPSEIRPFITAINRLLARVEQSMTTQRRFIAEAAHELRTPMAALSLQAERLGTAQMSDEARERLQRLRQGIERGGHLLDQLLGLAKAQGSAAVAASPVSLQTVCCHVLQDLLPLAEAKRIDLGMAPGSDAYVMTTEADLAAIVRNLVDNAIRYTPPDGRVDVRVTRQGPQAVLQVEDNGPGIPTDERARVLDPFHRVLGTDERGAGLGLSIVSAVVERLGGRIEMDHSQNFGHGLCIRVILPEACPQVARDAPSRSSAGPVQGAKGIEQT